MNSPQPINHHCLDIHNFNWPVRDRFLVWNPVSQFWTVQAIAESPVRIAGLAVSYLVGIVGYALSLTFRICVFVKEFFHLIIAFVTHLGKQDFYRTMRVRILCFLGATGELLSNGVGLVSPPIAYWIDEKIQENRTIYRHSSFRGARVEPGEYLVATLGSVMEDLFGNGREELEVYRPHLRLGLATLRTYFDGDAISDQAPLTLYQLSMLGFLNQWNAHQENENIFRQRREAVLNSDYWNNLRRTYESNEIINFLVLRTVQRAIGEELSLTADDYLEGKEEELRVSLENIANNLSFQALYEFLHNRNRSICDEDRRYFALIGTLSGLLAAEDD